MKSKKKKSAKTVKSTSVCGKNKKTSAVKNVKAGKVRTKNLSIKEIVNKVTDTIKKPFSKPSGRKPFGGKGGRKRAPTEIELRQAEARERIAEIEHESEGSSNATNSNMMSAFSGFFYTDEKFITQFEDKEILAYIQDQYPEFDSKKYDEVKLKKTLLKILGDSKFMSGLLDHYGMTILEFFKFLFRVESSIFKGAFITKIQNTIKRKRYAAVKKHCYRFQKQNKSRKKRKYR